MLHGCSYYSLSVSHFEVYVSTTELENRLLPTSIFLHSNDANLAERCIPEEPVAFTADGGGEWKYSQGKGEKLSPSCQCPQSKTLDNIILCIPKFVSRAEAGF